MLFFLTHEFFIQSFFLLFLLQNVLGVLLRVIFRTEKYKNTLYVWSFLSFDQAVWCTCISVNRCLGKSERCGEAMTSSRGERWLVAPSGLSCLQGLSLLSFLSLPARLFWLSFYLWGNLESDEGACRWQLPRGRSMGPVSTSWAQWVCYGKFAMYRIVLHLVVEREIALPKKVWC